MVGELDKKEWREEEREEGGGGGKRDAESVLCIETAKVLVIL